MKPEIPSSGEWTTVVTAKRPLIDFNFAEIWRYRDLVYLLVRRDFIASYKQTILGPLWFLIQPLFSTIVFTIIFGQVAKLPTDNIPPFLFYMCGLVAWGYFADCLNKSASTFTGNANIFSKVYFPRLTVPVRARRERMSEQYPATGVRPATRRADSQGHTLSCSWPSALVVFFV